MSDNNIGNGIVQLTGLGIEAGLALGTINMINRQLDPRSKKRRRCRR